MNKFNKTVSYIIVLTLLTSSFSQYGYAAGGHSPQGSNIEFVSLKDIEALQNSPQIEEEKTKMVEALNEFDNATDNTLPQKTKDIFFLTRQKLIIHSKKIKNSSGLSIEGQTFSLLAPNTPNVITANFDEQVKISSDRSTKTITLQYFKKSELIASHVIEGFDVVASARDKEFFTFVDKSGKIYTFDAALASQIAFRAPLPIFEVAEMPRELVTDNLKATYRVRGALPNMPIDPQAVVPLDVAENSIFLAGSFDIYDTAKRSYVGIYVRNGLRQHTYTGETILNLLALIVNPGETTEKSIESVHREAADPGINSLTSAYAQNLDPALRAMLRSLPPHVIDQFSKRLKQNKAARGEALDKFTAEENQKMRDLLVTLADQEKGIMANDADLRKVHKELLDNHYNPKVTFTEQMISNLKKPKNLKIIGLVVAGLATLGTASALAWHGVGPAWAVHFVHQAYDLYVPAVAKTAGYKVTALLSTFSMLMFMPLLFVIGGAYSKLTSLGMGTVRATAKLGMTIWGTISLPFFHYVARLASQPNFIRALQNGINPLVKVATEEGFVRPGFNRLKTKLLYTNVKDLFSALFKSDSYKTDPIYQKTVERNTFIIKQLADKRNTQKALAQALALLVVGQESGLDPVSIMVTQDGAYTPEHLEQMATNKEYRQLWLQTAKELESTLVRLQMDVQLPVDKNIQELDPQTFDTALQIAQATVQKIKSRPALLNLARRYIPAWNQLGRKLFMYGSWFGVEESSYLKEANPSRFVEKQFFMQFTVDYSLAVPQFTYFSARSNPDDIAALAAKPTDDMIQKYMDNHKDFNWDRNSEIIKNAEGHVVYDGSRYYLWTNPQVFASDADQVRIYGVNVPSSLSLVYDKYNPIVDGTYTPIETIQYKGVPRSETILESFWNIAKDAVNLKKAKYGTLWMTQYSKRIKTMQAALMFYLGERIFAGQAAYPALLAYGYSFFIASLLYGYWIWDPVQKGMSMRDERIEVAVARLTDVKVSLSQAIRFNSDVEMAQQYKLFVNYYKETKTAFPQEIEDLLPSIEQFLQSEQTAMIPELQKQVKEHGLNLIKYSAEVKAPFATGENKTINWGLILFASIATTYLGSFLDVATYKPASIADRWDLLFHALRIWLTFYTTAYALDKFMDKWDSRVGETDAFKFNKKQMENFKNKTNQEAAKSFLKLSELYSIAEIPLPKELKDFNEDLMIFLSKNEKEMPEELATQFKEKTKQLLKFVNEKPPYSTSKPNKALDKVINAKRGVNEACKTYIKAVGGIFTTK